MTIETIISLLVAFGVGSLFTVVLQHWLENLSRKDLRLEELKSKRYLAIIIMLIAKLEPKHGLEKIKSHRPDIANLNDLNNELKTELFNSLLFASDSVVMNLTEFLQKPTANSYQKTVMAMRKDMFGSKTELTENSLELSKLIPGRS